MTDIALSLLRYAFLRLPKEAFVALTDKILYGDLAEIPMPIGMKPPIEIVNNPEAATRIAIALFLDYIRRGEFDKIRMV